MFKGPFHIKAPKSFFFEGAKIRIRIKTNGVTPFNKLTYVIFLSRTANTEQSNKKKLLNKKQKNMIEIIRIFW